MSTTDTPTTSPPAFIPLEANPELMTTLLHNLGLSPTLAIHDVYSLTDPDLLSFIPRPALALLLVFPVSAAYESHRLAEDASLPDFRSKTNPPTQTQEGEAGAGEKEEDEPVLWFPQTIRNACGLIGLLHASLNGPARSHIQPRTTLSHLLSASQRDPTTGHRHTHPAAARAKLLEQNADLARAHRAVASQGDTTAPAAEDDVDLHYVCFVKGGDGGLWEMDGRRKGPLRRGGLEEGEDVLSEKALAVGPLKFLEREGGDLRFSCVALAGSLD
ncbi:ubiquitin carboxyl-terminal hydrolase-like protein [Chaetomium sp. MPI-SDFR-AT-0129]|nr:ubiquitin carboxyl-terminal hydrolase-like protein [Chaetomium sp. MPI-SDFR-AT-0129]